MTRYENGVRKTNLQRLAEGHTNRNDIRARDRIREWQRLGNVTTPEQREFADAVDKALANRAAETSR